MCVCCSSDIQGWDGTGERGVNTYRAKGKTVAGPHSLVMFWPLLLTLLDHMCIQHAVPICSPQRMCPRLPHRGCVPGFSTPWSPYAHALANILLCFSLLCLLRLGNFLTSSLSSPFLSFVHIQRATNQKPGSLQLIQHPRKPSPSPRPFVL